MKYLKKYNEHITPLIFKKEYDEDYLELKAYIKDNEVGKITTEIMFDPHLYILGDELGEDEIYNIFPEDIIVKIEYISIDDDFKGLGIAKELMTEALSTMKDDGYTQFFLNASPMGFGGLSLNTLVEFYKKFGFKEIINQGNNVLMYLVV